MSAVYTIFCNACGARAAGFSYKGISEARTINAGQGWTNPRQAQDFCRACSERQATKRREENPNGYH